MYVIARHRDVYVIVLLLAAVTGRKERGKSARGAAMDTFSFFPLGTLLSTSASDPIRSACASLGRMPLASFSALAAAAASRVAGGGSSAGDALERHPALSQAGAPASGAECLRVLLALLVDFARCGVAPPAARGAVEDGGLPAAHAAAFCDAYGAALAGMRAALGASSAWRAGGHPRAAAIWPPPLPPARTFNRPPPPHTIPFPRPRAAPLG